jgi:hypothetical protein
MQYRNERHACTWRMFSDTNGSITGNWAYSVEFYVHEAMAQSEHR